MPKSATAGALTHTRLPAVIVGEGGASASPVHCRLSSSHSAVGKTLGA